MTLEEALGKKNDLLAKLNYDPSQLPEPFKAIHLIESLSFEISNGGVSQWLINESGAYAEDTISALSTIGATKVSELVSKIVKSFPGERVPRDEVVRAEQVASLLPERGEAWNKIGNQVLTWPDDIDFLLRRYVASKV